MAISLLLLSPPPSLPPGLEFDWFALKTGLRFRKGHVVANSLLLSMVGNSHRYRQMFYLVNPAQRKTSCWIMVRITWYATLH